MSEYIKKDEVLKEVYELYEVIKEIQETGGSLYRQVLAPLVQDMIILMADIDDLETINI